MKHIAFVTSKQQPNLTPSDATVVPMLLKNDILVTAVPWESHVDWNTFDMIIIRSAWNYHLKYKEFMSWLNSIEQQNLNIWNAVPTLRWNTMKTYITTMVDHGISIVPTSVVISDKYIPHTFRPWTKIVVKPAVSASAYETKTYDEADSKHWSSHIRRLLNKGPVLVQQYMDSIHDGEYSYIFFNKIYSHAVLKIPKNGDFRIQEEYGGSVVKVDPPIGHIQSAQSVLDQIPEPLLYARVDGLVTNGSFILMEIELCEPELFLHTNAEAPMRFAKTIIQFLHHNR